MKPIEIDPDIRRAETLPGCFYTDPEVFARARERLFPKSWQIVGDAERVRVPGAVEPFELLAGCLDESLMLVRDGADRLHCLSNVCTHRGNLVVEHAGVVPGLRCRYHGRRFALDGRFQQMPGFEGVERFPSAADDLPRLATGTLGPIVFASLDPARSFAEELAPVTERIGWLPLGEHRLDPSRSRDYLVAANWALYVENYLEGFHIPYVHPALATVVETASYRTETFANGTLQLADGRGAAAAFEPPPGAADAGRRVAAYYYWLFPNTMLNFYPWGLSVNIVRPLAVDRTRVSFLAYVRDPSLLGEGAGAELDRVEREDEQIVEQVQKGLRSRLYRRGRYSPTEEVGVHHFHRMLVDAIG